MGSIYYRQRHSRKINHLQVRINFVNSVAYYYVKASKRVKLEILSSISAVVMALTSIGSLYVAYHTLRLQKPKPSPRQATKASSPKPHDPFAYPYNMVAILVLRFIMCIVLCLSPFSLILLLNQFFSTEPVSLVAFLSKGHLLILSTALCGFSFYELICSKEGMKWYKTILIGSCMLLLILSTYLFTLIFMAEQMGSIKLDAGMVTKVSLIILISVIVTSVTAFIVSRL